MSVAKQQLIERFRASAIERLRRVGLELSAHEGEHASRPLEESVLRELHTIKGESHMLGLHAVSRIIHRIEELLAPVRHNGGQLTSETLSLVRHGVTLLVHVLGTTPPAEDALRGALATLQAELDEGAALPLTAGSAASSPPSSKPASFDSAESADGSLPSRSSGNFTPSGLSAASAPSGSRGSHGLGRSPSTPDAAALPLLPQVVDPHGHRWVHVNTQRVDELCDSTSELETAFRALFAQSQVTLSKRAPSVQALRALREEFERCQTQFDDVTSMVWALRLVPVEPMLVQLAQHAHDLARGQGKRVRVQVHSGSAQLERTCLDSLWEPLLHLVRNAIDHGIEPRAERGDKSSEAALSLSAESQGSSVLLTVRDDGCGIDLERVRAAAVERGLMSEAAAATLTAPQLQALLFRQGFSTRRLATDLSGRGVGLDVVRSAVDAAGGTVELASVPGLGTTFRLILPVRLSRERALVVGYSDMLFAIPARQVLDLMNLSLQTVRPVAGGTALWSRYGILPLSSLAVVLGIKTEKPPEEPLAMILTSGNQSWAFAVGGVLGEFELLRKPCDALMAACSGCVASATLDDGRLVLYVNPADLFRRAHSSGNTYKSTELLRPRRVLIVDDSAIIRQLAALLLRAGGYEISTADNGRQALTHCERQLPDLILSDLDMPEMDGLTLLTQVRVRWPRLPVIIFTNQSAANYRQQAQKLGANEYVVKEDFDQEALLKAVGRVLFSHREG